MTRGRKKDLTIPPSRSLTQQRDYRARKAQYLSELEDRCRRAEEENVALRQELDSLRAGLPFVTSVDPQLMAASSQLLKDLSAASVALQHFQKIAYPDTQMPETPVYASPSPSISASPQSGPSRLRPASFSSPSLSEMSLPFSDPRDEDSSCNWSENMSPRPPNSHSLRKILCLPSEPHIPTTDDSRRSTLSDDTSIHNMSSGSDALS